MTHATLERFRLDRISGVMKYMEEAYRLNAWLKVYITVDEDERVGSAYFHEDESQNSSIYWDD